MLKTFFRRLVKFKFEVSEPASGYDTCFLSGQSLALVMLLSTAGGSFKQTFVVQTPKVS